MEDPLKLPTDDDPSKNPEPPETAASESPPTQSEPSKSPDQEAADVETLITPTRIETRTLESASKEQDEPPPSQPAEEKPPESPAKPQHTQEEEKGEREAPEVQKEQPASPREQKEEEPGASEEQKDEPDDVSGSFLDRVIKHALQNKLTIGNFDTKKPFDIHRRPGFPAFGGSGEPGSSNEPLGCDKPKPEVSSSATTATKCDEETQRVIPSVTSSESAEVPSSSGAPIVSEMSRQDLIDSKYKTKEDLKAARSEASQQESPHSTSLYINAPDFSKLAKPNPLHVKPPDFQRAANQTQKLQIANPNFAAAKTQEQLAEMAKTHNYISDLRLKPKEGASFALEEPPPHVINKMHFSVPSTSSSEVPVVEPPKESVIYKPKHEMHMQYSKGQYETKLVTVPKVEPPSAAKIDEAFSLKEKERQLRQEGTIITVKSDAQNEAYQDYPGRLIEKYGNLGPEPKRFDPKVVAAPKDLYRTPRQEFLPVPEPQHRVEFRDHREIRTPMPPQPSAGDPYRGQKHEAPMRYEPRYDQQPTYAIDPRTLQRPEDHYSALHRAESVARMEHYREAQRQDRRSANPSPYHMDPRMSPSTQRPDPSQHRSEPIMHRSDPTMHRSDPNLHRSEPNMHRTGVPDPNMHRFYAQQQRVPDQSPHRMEMPPHMVDQRMLQEHHRRGSVPLMTQRVEQQSHPSTPMPQGRPEYPPHAPPYQEQQQLRSLSPRSRIIKEQLMHQEMQRHQKPVPRKEEEQFKTYLPPREPTYSRDLMQMHKFVSYPQHMKQPQQQQPGIPPQYLKEGPPPQYYQKDVKGAYYGSKPGPSAKPHPDLQRELPKDTIMYPVKAPPHGPPLKEAFSKPSMSPTRDYGKYKKQQVPGSMNPPSGPWPRSAQSPQSVPYHQSPSPSFVHPSPKQTPSPKQMSPVPSPSQFERYDKRVEFVDLTRQNARYGPSEGMYHGYRPYDSYQRPMETIARVEISKPVQEREPERKHNESYKIHVDISAAIKHESSRPYPYPSTSSKDPVQLTVSQVKPEYQVIKTPVIATAPSQSSGVKREAPEALDLSLKTVKTKADSTGIEKRDDLAHTLPRMDFIPNFSKHAPYDPRDPRAVQIHMPPQRAPEEPRPMERPRFEPVRFDPRQDPKAAEYRMEPRPPPQIVDHRVPPTDPRYINPVAFHARDQQLPQHPGEAPLRYDPRYSEPPRPDMRVYETQQNELRPDVIRVPQQKPPPWDPASKPKNKRLANHDLERIEDRKYVESILFNRKPQPPAVQYGAHYVPQGPLSPRKRLPEAPPSAGPPKMPKFEEARFPPHMLPELMSKPLESFSPIQKSTAIWHPGPPPPEEPKRESVILEAPTLRPEQKFTPQNLSSGSIGKGADKDVISKLKNSLEQKGQQRLMKKQNSSEQSEEDSKQDIASLLAARIRTKAELKGFHPAPVDPVEKPKTPIEPPNDIEGTSAFDVMDWENACNDFVEQLQDKSGKKRGRRKRAGPEMSSKDDIYFDAGPNQSSSLAAVPPEMIETFQNSSSDEDKPLQMLRQQSDGKEESKETKSVSDKIARNIKSRLMLERKIAARIGNSSSESETEDRPRPKKRVRKPRTRSRLELKANSDSSDDEELKPKASQDSQEGKKSAEDSKKDDSKAETPTKRKSLRRATVESEKEETMTRSRKKLEMERKISNSKVLRNEKIVQNIPIEKKSKNLSEVASKSTTTKQQGGSQKQGAAAAPSSATKKDELKRKLESDSDEENKNGKGKRKTRKSSKLETSSEEEPADVLNERLRPRKNKQDVSKSNSKDKLENAKKLPPKKPGKDEKSSKPPVFPVGWENQLYEYKKSLKVPTRLISVLPTNQHYSSSLPDLDAPSTSDASEFSETSKASTATTATTARIKCEDEEPSEANNSRSIIDLLHQRVIRPVQKGKKKLRPDFSSPKIIPKGVEGELLPTPGMESEKLFSKKSIFDLSILKSRTRTEQKNMKNQETIREVFGGEDRPLSAPPLGLEPVKTFEQKFSEIVEKMNLDFEDKIAKIKAEPEDEDTRDTMLDVSADLKEDERDLDTPSVTSERDLATPLSFKGPSKKKGRPKRKASSGFDYIRKKKKPSVASDGHPAPPKRRIAAVNYLQEKDENDISKEIRGWVLNKGVGENAMHKAARLGYLDVIAYCIFRAGVDVDTKDNAGYTALHEACTKGHLNIARLLLQCGANHSETAHAGVRPLHEAVQNNFIEMTRLLLSYGADPSLSTYAGQTPEALAETSEMTNLIRNYINDLNYPDGVTPWKLNEPWKGYDSDSDAVDLFEGLSELFESEEPRFTKEIITEKKDSNLNIMSFSVPDKNLSEAFRANNLKYKSCSVVLNNIAHMKSLDAHEIRKSLDQLDAANNAFKLESKEESDCEKFEIEESDCPLPPLYLLRDEGSEKWVLLNDLLTHLKVKSKDAVLKQIDPSTPTATLCKELTRELKMQDFIEKATCLQLLCAGEKLNARASKVILVRYNEAVKALFNVQTFVIKI